MRFHYLLLCLIFILNNKYYCQTISKEFLSSDEKLFTNEEINYLKNSTTLFILRDQDSTIKKDFEAAIYSAWNFTKIKVIQNGEINEYRDEDYSYFTLQGYNTSVSGSISYELPHLFLTLKVDDIQYCRIELFPNLNTMNLLSYKGKSSIEYIYQNSTIKNWTPSLLSLYLAEVQKNLTESKREYLYRSYKSDEKISNLNNNDTLYVLNYVAEIYNKWNGSENERHDIKRLFKKCPMTVVLISPEELEEKISNGEVEYVFDYVKSCTDKYVRIYSLKEGLIYQAYKAVSYNLKPKDIKKIFN